MRAHPGLHATTEDNGNHGQNHGKRDCVANNLPNVFVQRAEILEADSGHHGSGQGAQAQALDDVPVHILFDPVHDGAGTLGNCSKGEVSADRHGWVDAKKQRQQGRHQRATAHAGQTDQQADGKS